MAAGQLRDSKIHPIPPYAQCDEQIPSAILASLIPPHSINHVVQQSHHPLGQHAHHILVFVFRRRETSLLRRRQGEDQMQIRQRRMDECFILTSGRLDTSHPLLYGSTESFRYLNAL